MLPVLTISTYKGRLLQPLRHQFENWWHLPLHRGGLGALRIDTAYHWTNSSANSQFAEPQNDTERVRLGTKTDHVRHDLSAATRRQIPNLSVCRKTPPAAECGLP